MIKSPQQESTQGLSKKHYFDLSTTEIESDSSLLHVNQKLEQPLKGKDNRVKAIVGINIYSFSYIAVSFLFKRAISTGVHVIDFQIFRNLSLLFFSGAFARFLGLNPFNRDFPT